MFNVVDPARVHKRNNESGGISLYDEENAESGEPGPVGPELDEEDYQETCQVRVRLSDSQGASPGSQGTS